MAVPLSALQHLQGRARLDGRSFWAPTGSSP